MPTGCGQDYKADKIKGFLAVANAALVFAENYDYIERRGKTNSKDELQNSVSELEKIIANPSAQPDELNLKNKLFGTSNGQRILVYCLNQKNPGRKRTDLLSGLRDEMTYLSQQENYSNAARKKAGKLREFYIFVNDVANKAAGPIGDDSQPLYLSHQFLDNVPEE